MYSLIGVRSRVRALDALLLLETITLPPPPRDLEEVSVVWTGAALSKPAQAFVKESFFSWTSTRAGFLKYNSGRDPHTGVECRVYL